MQISKVAVLALGLLGSLAWASDMPQMTLHKSPNCGCCDKYVDYLRASGVKIEVIKEANMGAVKQRLGVAADKASCHTATLGNYVVEGHVPIASLQKLLREQPDLIGISLPGMPASSPGMGPEQPGSLAILALSQHGPATLFNRE